MAELQKPITPHALRTQDITVFGATGFTGQLISKHLAKDAPHALKWAIAGRSTEKLNKLLDTLKAIPDATNLPEVHSLADNDLDEVVSSSRVVISTIGPYTLHGEKFLKACIENGTSWVDLTGEIPWVSDMISKYETLARKTGAVVSVFP
jgi:short subunit dehydrogenase-like uncharacterized protein